MEGSLHSLDGLSWSHSHNAAAAATSVCVCVCELFNKQWLIVTREFVLFYPA